MSVRYVGKPLHHFASETALSEDTSPPPELCSLAHKALLVSHCPRCPSWTGLILHCEPIVLCAWSTRCSTCLIIFKFSSQLLSWSLPSDCLSAGLPDINWTLFVVRKDKNKNNSQTTQIKVSRLKRYTGCPEGKFTVESTFKISLWIIKTANLKTF
jgi:hypothetical protein